MKVNRFVNFSVQGVVFLEQSRESMQNACLFRTLQESEKPGIIVGIVDEPTLFRITYQPGVHLSVYCHQRGLVG